MSARPLAVFLGALAVAGPLGYGLLSDGGGSPIAAGETMPDAEPPTLDGGGTGTISEHRGKWLPR